LHHGVDLAAHLAICEAQDLVPPSLQFLVTDGITLPVLVKTVLMTVDLHDEKRLAALEIDDVGLQWRLSAKMMTDGTQFAQAKPELHLLQRHRLS